MNFEEIKELWDNEPDEKKLEEKSIHLSDQSNPIRKILSMFKHEFISTWISILFLGVILYYKKSEYRQIALFVYFIAVFTTIYYHTIFYRFYRKTKISAMNTYQNLIEFNIEFKYAIHLYRSYNYIISLMLVPIIFILIKVKIENVELNTLLFQLKLYIIIVFLISIIIITELWVYFFYKRQLRKLEKIMNQFEE